MVLLRGVRIVINEVMKYMYRFFVSIFVLVFFLHGIVYADSIFVDSGIAYKKNADNTVCVILQEDQKCYAQVFKDSLLVVPSNVNHEGKTYQVKGIEQYAFAKWCGIKKVIISEGVEKIDDGAFLACANLESMSIPSSVKVIGNKVLSFCINLTSIVVDAHNPIFDSRNKCNAIIRSSNNELIYGCQSTKIPSSVITIASHAYEGCMTKTVKIPLGIKNISPFAFSGCYNLESVYISSSVDNITWDSFDSCFNITTIEIDKDNATYDSRNNCNAIIDKETNALIWGCSTSKIPTGVTEIGENAFWGCRNLHSITIPEGVKTIGESAFYGCSGLKQVILPSSLEEFWGGSQFGDCISLESIRIPENVEFIPSNIFGGCLSLREITVDPRNKVYDSRNNCNAIIQREDNELVTGCNGSVIVDGIKRIGEMAFYNSGITSIHIPASVEAIDPSAFQANRYCRSISVDKGNAFYKSENSNSIVERKTKKMILACSATKILPEVLSIGAYAYMNASSVVVIPEGIETIGDRAFMGCEDLHTVFIPTSVKTIGELAFAYCKQLTNVIMQTGYAKIDKYAFVGCDALRPAGQIQF